MAEVQLMNVLSDTTPLPPSSDSLGEDQQLVDNLLGELYDRYEARIYSYIYRRTGNESLAEELTAEVFLKMLEAIQADKGWHSSFSGWLYRIAHNRVIDYYRQRDRKNEIALTDTFVTTASDHNPVVMAEQSLNSQIIRMAIGRLTEEQSDVITLRFLEGYSIAEVAEILNKTEGSIKALQYRAITELRKMLAQQLPEHSSTNESQKKRTHLD